MVNQKLIAFLIALLLLSITTSKLFAQQSGILEEIVVTANKRGEVSIQETPGSIQAISSETLERTLVEGFEDYIKMVPGLTSVSSGSGQSQIVIRGVNSNRVTHTAAQTRSLAGLYIDEMPISLAGFNPDLGIIDVERIEVLKGPQEARHSRAVIINAQGRAALARDSDGDGIVEYANGDPLSCA